MELEAYTQELRFEGEDTPYPGLVVELNLNASWEYFNQTISGAGGTFVDTLARFGDEVLISWNLERDGLPVPADAIGFQSAPFHLIRFLIGEWRSAAVNPPPPLSKRLQKPATSAARSKRTGGA